MRKGLDLVHPLDGGGVVSGGLAADPGMWHLGEIGCFEMTMIVPFLMQRCTSVFFAASYKKIAMLAHDGCILLLVTEYT